eukprot:COSAG01_NODE_48696_length_378_cov_145.211470_1_plen_75_part_01
MGLSHFIIWLAPQIVLLAMADRRPAGGGRGDGPPLLAPGLACLGGNIIDTVPSQLGRWAPTLRWRGAPSTLMPTR